MVVNLKNGGHFTRFKSKNLAKKQLKTWQEQQEDNSKGGICYLVAWVAGTKREGGVGREKGKREE